jgi:triacylglycerol lipase
MASRLNSPIVLAHGLLGFSKIEVGGFVLASYFRRVPEILEAAGNTVLQTGVPPTGSIERRAEALRGAIRARFGATPVHIVAHSMGGLDARRMIRHLGMERQVLSLTTLGTPHRGSPVADRAVEIGERFGLLAALRTLGIADDAFRELGPDALEAFNQTTPDVPGVRYFAVAGKKRREEMFLVLRLGHDIIAPLEGDNDGLVSVRSASWGEHTEVWDCDHVNLIGWSSPREKLAGFEFDVETGYAGILAKLSREGF